MHTVEDMLALLEDKIVTTEQGRFISIDDLRKLEAEYKEAEAEDKPKGHAKTLFGARKGLFSDEEFMELFDDRPPTAPADADVVKPVAVREAEEDE